MNRRSGRVVSRHPQRVSGLGHQIENREEVGPDRCLAPKIFWADGNRFDVVVDQNPRRRIVLVVRDRRVRNSHPIFNNETGDRTSTVLPFWKVEDDRGWVDSKKVSTRGRRNRSRALSSGRDCLGALSDSKVIDSLWKFYEKSFFKSIAQQKSVSAALLKMVLLYSYDIRLFELQ